MNSCSISHYRKQLYQIKKSLEFHKNEWITRRDGENRGINERGRGGKRLIKNINPKSSILYIIFCNLGYIRVI
jgi:hypothetical protein